MRKYRVMELDNSFYPQEKQWCGWRYVDQLFGQFIWSKWNKEHSKCESLEYAKRCIERRKEWLEKGNEKPIYHEIL
jgi:hypothetical protein